MTAWLSFLFTYKGVYCHHEGLTSHDISTHKPMSVDGYTHVGSCDTNPLMFKQTEDPVVLVYRGLSDVHTSLLKHFNKPAGVTAKEWVTVSETHLYEYQQELDCIGGNVLLVDFESLQEKGTLVEMWEHLLPGVAVPHGWIDRLMLYSIGTKNKSLDGAIMETISINNNKDIFKWPQQQQ